MGTAAIKKAVVGLTEYFMRGEKFTNPNQALELVHSVNDIKKELDELARKIDVEYNSLKSKPSVETERDILNRVRDWNPFQQELKKSFYDIVIRDFNTLAQELGLKNVEINKTSMGHSMLGTIELLGQRENQWISITVGDINSVRLLKNSAGDVAKSVKSSDSFSGAFYLTDIRKTLVGLLNQRN